ncbi:MAG: hypothetical protein DYG89_40795 [Caldilinea sp. CFX5]|nr:hypothetical protein [Caldilinea sp. CFX5]
MGRRGGINAFADIRGSGIYRRALRTTEPDRRLYLAVPLEIYKTFFTLPFIQEGGKNINCCCWCMMPRRR